MATINARGAHEVARYHVGTGELRKVFVMTSDGRVLYRYTDPATDWKIFDRQIPESGRNMTGLAALVDLAYEQMNAGRRAP